MNRRAACALLVMAVSGWFNSWASDAERFAKRGDACYVRKLATRSLKFRVRTPLPITLQHERHYQRGLHYQGRDDRGDVPMVGFPNAW